jgi:hypothetical protein
MIKNIFTTMLPTAQKKTAHKTKYRSFGGEGAAWGKPGFIFISGDCECRLEAELEDGE